MNYSLAQTIIGVLMTIINMVTAFILAMTAGLVWWYARWAKKQTKSLIETNIFDAMSRINETLTDPMHYKWRGYLHGQFMNHLVIAVREELGAEYFSTVDGKEQIDIKKVLASLEENEQQLSDFNKALRGCGANDTGFATPDSTSLDAVEGVLTAFDLIAIPFCLGYELGRKVALAYEPILRSTAPKLLPFIAIQTKLRGKRDPRYKSPYLHLLAGLDIPRMGLDLPESLWSKKTRRKFNEI